MSEAQMDVTGRIASEGDSNRAAIYVRTSSPNQRLGYSIDEQLRRCFHRCKFLDWDIAYVFQDEAESGKDTERPMFQQMMEAAKAGCFDVIVFWKLDRFSRSLLHAVQLEKDLRESGVALHSVTEQIDTTTSAGRFNFRNIANAAEFEREMISERSQMGLKALALEGKWPNNHPPIGYQKTTEGKLEDEKTEAGVVKGIFERYLETKSMPQVAQQLNQQGIETKKGKEWCGRAVADVLGNELYMGVYTVGGVVEFVPELQIVAPKCFAKAQKVRHRFRSDEECKRQSMPRSQKETVVNGIVDEYHSFLEKEDQ